MVSARSDRVLELDGLRAFAILAVFAMHILNGGPKSLGEPSGFPPAIDGLFGHGWLGVDLFFVLSGFLITSILLATRARGARRYFGRFYQRRALRILPLCTVVIALLAIVYAPSVGFGFVWLCAGFAANLAPLTDVRMPDGAGPMWSLAVEEQFYLIWPVLVLFLDRRALAWVAGAIVLAEPVLRYFLASGIEYNYPWFRCDGLAAGALLALWATWPGRTRRFDDRLAAGLIACAVASSIVFWRSDDRLGSSVRIDQALFVFAALVVFGVTHARSARTAFLRAPFLVLTAELSFCLYLVHVPLLGAYEALETRIAPHHYLASALGETLLRTAVVVLLAYAIAALSRRSLELPFIAMGRSRDREATAVTRPVMDIAERELA